MNDSKTYKVYGAPGHRMKFSFYPSTTYDFTNDWSDNGRIITVECSDKTGTNDYVIVTIEMNTKFSDREIDLELFAQLDDGIFENMRYGDVYEVWNDGESLLEDPRY